jgi:hypothetical protein
MVAPVIMSNGTTHGTYSSYSHGCRCKSCKSAAKVYWNDYGARVRNKTSKDNPRADTHDAKMNTILDIMVELGMAEYSD